MQTYSMFPSQIYKTRIDPKSYDKEEIIRTAMENYEKDPSKNNWDDESDLHHCYGTMYDAPPALKSLSSSYGKAIDECMNSISKNHNKFEYRWKMVNFAVNTKYMAPHDHFYKIGDWQSTYSCCHYISYHWKYHSPTRFLNPLVIAQYHRNLVEMSNLLDKNAIDNSTYFVDGTAPVEEDDMIIFPSYLKHVVKNGMKRESDKPRILGVANIDWKV